MSRTTAIVLTIVTTVFCGIPGIGVICFGLLGGVGTQMPGFEGDASPGSLAIALGMFFCLGSILILIPILVGFFSFKLSSVSQTAQATTNEPLPPPS